MKHLVHQFSYKNKYLALDVCSNSLLELDPLSYRIMDLYRSGYEEQAIVAMIEQEGHDTDREDIINTLHDIIQLRTEGTLFTEDVIPREPLFGDETIIKAMCLHIAHDCNLRCNYCFAASGHFGGQRTMLDVETGKKAIDFLITHSKSRKHLEIDFFGGEPLMNFQVTQELVEYAKEMATKHDKVIKLTLTTNGVLLTPEIREYLNRENISLVLSLDGRKHINDNMRHTLDGSSSYEVIVPNLQATVAERNYDNYNVRGTYTSRNLDFAEDVKHMRDLGFQNISVEPVVAPENMGYALTEEHLPKIAEQYEALADEYISTKGTDKQFTFFHFQMDLENGPCLAKRLSGCGAGHHYVAVTPEGDIYPCHQFVGKEQFLLGNVHRGLDQPERMEQFKHTNIYTKPACSQCWARFMCAGGCHANAHGFNDDINIPYSTACEITKKRLETALYIKAVELSE